MITGLKKEGSNLFVVGTTHDNGAIQWVRVNGKDAATIQVQPGVVDWIIRLDYLDTKMISARAKDASNNVEMLPHKVSLASRKR